MKHDWPVVRYIALDNVPVRNNEHQWIDNVSTDLIPSLSDGIPV